MDIHPRSLLVRDWTLRPSHSLTSRKWGSTPMGSASSLWPADLESDWVTTASRLPSPSTSSPSHSFSSMRNTSSPCKSVS
eukprot:12436_1